MIDRIQRHRGTMTDHTRPSLARMHSSVEREIARLERLLLTAQLNRDHELCHELAEAIDDLIEEKDKED